MSEYEKSISLYDDGIGAVHYVDHMGSDLTVVNSARVSFGVNKSELDGRDRKLINYLIRHRHTSTLEHNSVTFKFVVPLYVRSQHHRHRTWSYNEISRRIEGLQKKNIAVVIEQVSAMPGQGVTSMFNFGQSFGVLKGICSAMQLSMYFVRPAKWKKYYGLIKTEKDASRTKVIEIFPYISSKLSKKKDSNKADAILIANFFNNTYQKAE